MTKSVLLVVKILLISQILFVFSYCSDSEEQNKDSSEEVIENQQPKRIVELSYFKEETGWGYNVSINGKNYIHQVHLPCECGGEGFTSKEKAMKAAEFLKKKIENYDRSLYISRAQLDSLGAL